jgi:Flp pilus assembly protein TadG
MTTANSLPGLLDTLRRDERGSIMAWTALGLVSLLGMAALTVDMGYMYVLNNQLQTTADAAASAAAKALPDETAALAAAQDVVQQNMPSSAHGNVITAADVHFGNWDSATRTFTDGGSPTNAVRVNARRDDTNNNAARTFFASTLGFADVSIGAQSIALQGGGGGQACLISLEASADDALHMNSNAQIDLQGCGVRVNSTSSSGLSLNANAYLHADSIQVAANGFQDGVNTDVAPSPELNAGQITDPLEYLQDNEPTPAACTSGNRVNRNFKTNQTILPGTYCGGIRIGFSGAGNPDSGCTAGGGGGGNVTITMTPGTYILTDSAVGQPRNCGGPVTAATRRAGMLELASNTTLNATGGVFIYITGATNVNGTNPIVDLNSNSSVNLVAPSSGPYAGIAIYQDDALQGLTNRMNSNSNKNYKGAIYFPESDLLMDSNGEINTNTECSVFIARRFQFDSNARLSGTFNLSENCPASLATAMEGTGGSGGSTTTTLVK